MFRKKKKRIKELVELAWKLYDEKMAYKEAQEQVSKIQNAYITVLLEKLGATSEEKVVTITDDEIKRAMAVFETKGNIEKIGEWKLYCEEITPAVVEKE